MKMDDLHKNRRRIMTIRSAFLALPLFCILISGVRGAYAQNTSQAIVRGPIAIASPASKDKHCFRGEVIAATNAAITVRDRRDERRIRTLTCSPDLAAKMRDIVAHGNFQPGDKVKISCHARHNEAYAIKGKPSAPC
jgi:hypothetical protein